LCFTPGIAAICGPRKHQVHGRSRGSSATTKAIVDDTKPTETPKEQQKPAAALEEDDEFEDFPVEGLQASSCVRIPLEKLFASFL
jgi:hypothetical protein